MKRAYKTIEKIWPTSVYLMMDRYVGEDDRFKKFSDSICFSQDDLRIYVKPIKAEDISACRMFVCRTDIMLSAYAQYRIAKAFINMFFDWEKDNDYIGNEYLRKDTNQIIRNIRRNK